MRDSLIELFVHLCTTFLVILPYLGNNIRRMPVADKSTWCYLKLTHCLSLVLDNNVIRIRIQIRCHP